MVERLLFEKNKSLSIECNAEAFQNFFWPLSAAICIVLRQLLPVIGINDVSAISGQQSGNDAAFDSTAGIGIETKTHGSAIADVKLCAIVGEFKVPEIWIGRQDDHRGKQRWI